MNLLREEILPLFNQIPVESQPQTNELIQTAMNEYTIYVQLEDVYQKKCQNHLLPTSKHQKTEHNLPIYYHQILLPHRGLHHDDLLVKVKTLKHNRFLRVNSHDLFYCLKVNENQMTEKETVKFKHLDDSEVDVELHPNMNPIIRFEGLGLPKTDKARGNLYVLVKVENDCENSHNNTEKLEEILLEILNYDATYSNVEH